MALILVRAWRDWVCPICWTFCEEHATVINGKTTWKRASIVETELIVYGLKRAYEPVGLSWVDVRQAVSV